MKEVLDRFFGKSRKIRISIHENHHKEKVENVGDILFDEQVFFDSSAPLKFLNDQKFYQKNEIFSFFFFILKANILRS